MSARRWLFGALAVSVAGALSMRRPADPAEAPRVEAPRPIVSPSAPGDVPEIRVRLGTGQQWQGMRPEIAIARAWSDVRAEGWSGWLVTEVVPRWTRWRPVPDPAGDDWLRPSDMSRWLVHIDPWLAVAALDLDASWSVWERSYAPERARAEMSAACGCDWQFGDASTPAEDRRYHALLDDEVARSVAPIREAGRELRAAAPDHPASDLAALYALDGDARTSTVSDAPQLQRDALDLLLSATDPGVARYAATLLGRGPQVVLSPEDFAGLDRVVSGREAMVPQVVWFGTEASVAQGLEVPRWGEHADRAMACDRGADAACGELQERWPMVRAGLMPPTTWRDALQVGVEACFTPELFHRARPRTSPRALATFEGDRWVLVSEQPELQAGFDCAGRQTPSVGAPEGHRVVLVVVDMR